MADTNTYQAQANELSRNCGRLPTNYEDRWMRLSSRTIF